MDTNAIAALVAAQTPDHASCRAQELVEFDGLSSTVTVQCACNVRLTLSVPRTVESADPIVPATIAKPAKVGDDVA